MLTQEMATRTHPVTQERTYRHCPLNQVVDEINNIRMYTFFATFEQYTFIGIAIWTKINLKNTT